ncbi:hypothetical protein D0Z07_4953 [Hyphodiscus hymeniophilus]|uniref:Phosducin n=1 Tax=Hyphodiscus hymeniophilus TaxID=353542 RepID=A0A9P6VJL8_9HELO|nr:hypothetical protein D0Z07_4953 [Hyphodiscus hymeniophilus]
MAAKSAAQEEFDSIVQKSAAGNKVSHHPNDSEDYKYDRAHSDRDEEEEYIQKRIDENMRIPALDHIGGRSLRLPPKEFDRGRTTVISDALTPLVASHPAVHFVRVHYEDIEFDNAGVPAILAYKNQGDLFANLTYVIDQIPDESLFDTQALEIILRKHQVL